jgi:hypothetical protein
MNVVAAALAHIMRGGGNGGNVMFLPHSMRLDKERRVWHTLRMFFDIPSRGVILSSIGEISISA